MDVARQRKGSNVTRVYEALRAKILSLDLEPGRKIDEAALAREFGVSRTPVRESLVRLASEGLVVLLPNRGSQVAPLDLASVRDYLEAIDLCQRAVTSWAALRRRREHLEPIEHATQRFEEAVAARDTDQMILANRAFHAAIADACGNAHVGLAYKRLLDEGLRFARFTLNELYYRKSQTYQEFVETVVKEHRQIVEAVIRQDARTAESLAAAHTEHTRVRFTDFLSDSLSPGISIWPVMAPEPGGPRGDAALSADRRDGVPGRAGGRSPGARGRSSGSARRR
ncbi:MAG: GntR family transcriptional regulator [Candidatus Rokubacteria bacterium]|nr:GntR family transcriptional regulator [Candidatus Rokubacteria bacterium]MBI3824825.1 GntR family transcriptional regulator [Candidatus Rokubacteria bacterium]